MIFQKKRMALCLLLLWAVSLAACFKVEPESNAVFEEAIEEEASRDDERDIVWGNKLRLAAFRTDTWHPLEQTEAANKYALALVYRGLFMIDSSERLSSDLAESAAFSEDGLNLVVSLRKDLSFDDGRKLTSRDCAASLQYYRNFILAKAAEEGRLLEYYEPLEISQASEESVEEILFKFQNTQLEDKVENSEELSDIIESADLRLPAQVYTESDLDGLRALSGLHSIEILDEHLFRLKFNDYYPQIIYRLDFPILPASDLETEKEVFPATGSYRIKEVAGDRSLIFESRDQSAKISEILLKVYGTEDEMLRALTNDEVELIYLKESSYHFYSSRRDLRALPNPKGEYHLLLPGSGRSSIFNEQEIADAFFRLWLNHPDFANRITGLEASYFPLRSNSELWPYIRKYMLEEQSGANFWLSETTKLRMVAPDDIVVAENCRLLRDLFFKLNIELDITYYPEDSYSGVVKGGDYDFAYLKLDLDYPFYPVSFYNQLAYYRLDFADALNGHEEQLRNLADFQRLRLSVVEKMDFKQESLEQIAKDYFNLMTAVKFYGLGFASQGILYSSRIAEYFTVLNHDPYYYLKDVKVWQK